MTPDILTKLAAVKLETVPGFSNLAYVPIVLFTLLELTMTRYIAPQTRTRSESRSVSDASTPPMFPPQRRILPSRLQDQVRRNASCNMRPRSIRPRTRRRVHRNQARRSLPPRSLFDAFQVLPCPRLLSWSRSPRKMYPRKRAGMNSMSC